MRLKILLLSSLFLFVACQHKETHFLTDTSYRNQVVQDFNEKKALFENQSLFEVFEQQLSVQEREALMFLYAYMPLGDITDYSGDYYLANVRSSFRTREKMSWGDSIPELIFRHFVLPIRVNNENLDESRTVFFEELKDRVQGLSMKEAVLEVNHWCHEKVVYRPTDGRTSSPMASVKTAYGRCGEESTFTVAALRAVGIPARQVYTPRWAHTDDNHAWVEAWVDGKWFFLGACEPEPVLNKAWFNDAAYRAMLMHTRVFGAYDGPEEVMSITKNYTEINVIDTYTPTDRVNVTVVDANGVAVSDATVEYKIYNYAEFYSVATKKSDSSGKSFLSAGKGDLLVWASKDGRFGFQKVSIGKDKDVTIALVHVPGDTMTEEFDVVPPVEGSIAFNVTDEEIAENNERLIAEDEIRGRYEATFYNEEKASQLAKELGLDLQDVEKVMLASRGNWSEIESFLKHTNADQRKLAMDLLKVISSKDLRDTPESVLKDHLAPRPEHIDENIYVDYVMNPRVSIELLTPYKSFFKAEIDDAQKSAFLKEPALLVKFVSENIQAGDRFNSQKIVMFPSGVWKSKIADKRSRNIFFVALARSLEIPARIETVTQKVQYMNEGQWIDVDFENFKEEVAEQGMLTASYTPTKWLPDPRYYTHFSIAKLTDNGVLQTLNFEEGSDESRGDSWKTLFSKPLKLDVGEYAIVTGTRMASGKVLSEMKFFHIEKGKTTRIDLNMRQSKDDIQVIGSINAEALYTPKGGDEKQSILSTTGRGYFVLGVIGNGQEPSNHALKDISKYAQEFEQWGRTLLLLFPSQTMLDSFKKEAFPGLPKNIVFGVDDDGSIAQMIAGATNLSNAKSLPIICIADTFGRVVYVSQGYSIGVGEQMMKVILKL